MATESLADGGRAGPRSPGKRLADHRDWCGFHPVVVGERAPFEEPDTHRLEVPRRDGLEVRPRIAFGLLDGLALALPR
jgi:hypothetical protein